MNSSNNRWRLLRKVVGLLLLFIGLVALVTPLTPGAWLIIVGGELLGIEFLSHERLKGYYRRLVSWWYWRKVEKQFKAPDVEETEKKTNGR